MGSTKCVLDGLKNKKEYSFVSYECCTEMYKIAVDNNRGSIGERFNIINGKIVNENEITNWLDVSSLSNEQKGWLGKDIKSMSQVNNVLDAVPKVIDLLILDGGEFSTYNEWLLLKDRTKYVIIDDTKTLKSKKIREEIIENKNYEVIVDCLGERNGYLIGRL